MAKITKVRPPSFHVVRSIQLRDKTKWAVRKHRYKAVTSVHETKDEAIEEAERLAGAGGIVYIHDMHGRVEERREV